MIAFVEIVNDQGRRYDSYTDYWRLVELSGFPIVPQNVGQGGIDPDSDNTYILSPPNGNTHAMALAPRSPKCKLICWNLERPTGGFEGFAPPGYDQVWVSDGWIAQNLQSDPRVKFVPVGGHPDLAGDLIHHSPFAIRNYEYDLTHQAYVYGRRAELLRELYFKQGFTIGPPCWGEERDRQLRASRWGLCMHQDHLKACEPLRMTLFSCYGLPLVSEECHCPWPYRLHGLHEIRQATDGESNRWLLTEHLTFRRCVERAV